MLTRTRTGVVAVGLMSCQLAWPGLAFACPVCFGAADTDASRAIAAGVLVMLAIVAAVLAAFAWFFITLARRARMHETPMPARAARANALGGDVRC